MCVCVSLEYCNLDTESSPPAVVCQTSSELVDGSTDAASGRKQGSSWKSRRVSRDDVTYVPPLPAPLRSPDRPAQAHVHTHTHTQGGDTEQSVPADTNQRPSGQPCVHVRVFVSMPHACTCKIRVDTIMLTIIHAHTHTHTHIYTYTPQLDFKIAELTGN